MINCVICGHDMPPNGALLFSPPICETPMSVPFVTTTKFHICRKCYAAHIEPLFTITSREPIAKQPDSAQARLQFETETMTTTLPRPTISDKGLTETLRKAWHDVVVLFHLAAYDQKYFAKARAARKALTGEEKPPDG